MCYIFKFFFGEKMKNLIALSLLALITMSSPAFAQNHSMTQEKYQHYVSFQKNADIVRLNHLVYWGGLIEEYRQKVGHYPFANQSKFPIYVQIATPRQQSYFKDNQPPAPATEKPVKDFILELEKGLGREIDEYYDPQYAPDGKPNFYIYMIDKQNYNLAVHTFQPYPFSRYITENYHKVEISNNPNKELNIVKLNSLLKNSKFKQALNTPIEKIGFFNQREQESLHISKE